MLRLDLLLLKELSVNEGMTLAWGTAGAGGYYLYSAGTPVEGIDIKYLHHTTPEWSRVWQTVQQFPSQCHCFFKKVIKAMKF